MCEEILPKLQPRLRLNHFLDLIEGPTERGVHGFGDTRQGRVHVRRLHRECGERADPVGHGQQRRLVEGRLIEQRKQSLPRGLGLDPSHVHERVARESPTVVNPVDPANLHLLEEKAGRRLRLIPGGGVDEGQTDRLHSRFGLFQLDSGGMLDRVGPLAVEDLADHIGGLGPVQRDDDVILLDPPGPVRARLGPGHDHDLSPGAPFGDLGLGARASQHDQEPACDRTKFLASRASEHQDRPPLRGVLGDPCHCGHEP